MVEWNELVTSLPEAVRQDPALADVKDFQGLVTNYISAKKGAGDWRTALPEDLQKDPNLEPLKGKGLPDLVKSFINAQKLVGKDKIPLPGENAKPEEWTEFWKKLGRPEKPEDYKLVKPSDLPQGFPFEEKLLQEFSKRGHELGLNTKQIQGLYQWYLQNEVDTWNGMHRDAEQARQQIETDLRKEYGKAYDQRVTAARSLIEKYGDPELKKVLDSTGMGNNPVLIRFLVNVAGQFSEDTLKGMGKSQFNILAPEEARRQIDEMRMNKGFMDAYLDYKNPGHQAAVEKYRGLYEAAYPEEPKK